MPPSSVGSLTPEPILGTWRQDYTCEKFLQALLARVSGSSRPRRSWISTSKRIRCNRRVVQALRRANEFQRTHVLKPNGYLTNYRGDRVVDDCRCYMLVDDHTFVVLGDPGDPDIPLQYRIDADAGTLTFEAVPPDPCSEKCQRGYAFAIGQFAIGVWHRVN